MPGWEDLFHKILDSDFESLEAFVASDLFHSFLTFRGAQHVTLGNRVSELFGFENRLGLLRALPEDSLRDLASRYKNAELQRSFHRAGFRTRPRHVRQSKVFSLDDFDKLAKKIGVQEAFGRVANNMALAEVIAQARTKYFDELTPRLKRFIADPFVSIKNAQSPITARWIGGFTGQSEFANAYVSLKKRKNGFLPGQSPNTVKYLWYWPEEKVSAFLEAFEFSRNEVSNIPGMESWLRQYNLMSVWFGETDCLSAGDAPVPQQTKRSSDNSVA